MAAVAAVADTDELDSFLLPTRSKVFPARKDDAGWLEITQICLTNVRGMVLRGKSETADRVMEHYWTRWAAAA